MILIGVIGDIIINAILVKSVARIKRVCKMRRW